MIDPNFFKPNYDEIVETIRLVAPYFDDFILEPQEGNEEQIVLRWRQTGCEDVFNASQLSDGTLRFICLTTLLLQPHELQPATIIIDEPELGHIPMQSRFSLRSCGSFPLKSRSLFPRNL